MNLAGRSYATVLLIVLIGIVGQWVGGELYHLWRAPAAVLLALLWWEWRLSRRPLVALDRQLPAQAALGRPFDGHLQLSNPGLAPTAVEVQHGYPDGVLGARSFHRCGLAPGESATLPLRGLSQRLGKASWPPIYLRERGRFGLAWWRRVVADPHVLETVPDTLARRRPAAASHAQGLKTHALASAGTELLGLRDYRPGDPLRAVDWKATARSGRTTVRTFNQEQHLELVIAIDVGRASRLQAGPLTRLHHYVNVAARLAEAAIESGDRVGLVTFAGEVRTVAALEQGTRGLRGLRAKLGEIESESADANPLAAALQIRSMLRHRGLVVLLTELGDEQAAAQLFGAVAMLSQKHLPLVAAIVDEEVAALAGRAATDWLDPYRNLAALELRRADQLAVERLRRLGAEVLHEPADRLDAALLGRYAALRAHRRV